MYPSLHSQSIVSSPHYLHFLLSFHTAIWRAYHLQSVSDSNFSCSCSCSCTDCSWSHFCWAVWLLIWYLFDWVHLFPWSPTHCWVWASTGSPLGCLTLFGCLSGPPTACISHWQSWLWFAYILSIYAIQTFTLTDFEQSIDTLQSMKSNTWNICLSFDEIRNSLSTSGLPQLNFDQLWEIQHINDLWHQQSPAYVMTPSAHWIIWKSASTQLGLIEWLASEYELPNQYETQGTSGHPCIPPLGTAFFHCAWTYKIKEEDNNCKGASHFVMAPPMGAIVKLFVKLKHPLQTWISLYCSLPFLLLKTSWCLVQMLPILLLKPMLLHRYTSCRLMSTFMNGGTVLNGFSTLSSTIFSHLFLRYFQY